MLYSSLDGNFALKVYVHDTTAVFYNYWTIQIHNLNLTVVFSEVSFLVGNPDILHQRKSVIIIIIIVVIIIIIVIIKKIIQITNENQVCHS